MRLPADMVHDCSENRPESDCVTQFHGPPWLTRLGRMQITFTQSI